jgi:hypothetical protein
VVIGCGKDFERKFDRSVSRFSEVGIEMMFPETKNQIEDFDHLT